MYIIYKTTCKINGKIYVGQHKTEILEAHDGMGMKSWINFTVKVLPERPRSVSTKGASGYRTPFENRD